MNKIFITLIPTLTAAVVAITTLSGCSLLSNRSQEADAQPKQQVVKTKEMPYVHYKEDTNTGVKKRLMILPFLDVAAERPQSLRDNAREEVIRDLNRTKKLVVINSRELKIDLSQNIKNGEYDLEAVSKKALDLGVGAVLEGKVLGLRIKRDADQVGLIRQMKSQFECIVRVRIVAARNARELLNITKTVTLEDSSYRVAERVDSDRLVGVDPLLIEQLVRDSFIEFTPQILASLEKLGWEGRIAMVQGDRIFLNVGQVSGLQVGDILKVLDEGDEVFDPETGNKIGKVPGRVKGTVEIISFFGNDGSIAVIHSGAGFKDNDRVELY